MGTARSGYTQWAERLAQKNPFISLTNGEIVGMAELEPDGFVDYFYVHPCWQNKESEKHCSR